MKLSYLDNIEILTNIYFPTKEIKRIFSIPQRSGMENLHINLAKF